MAKKYKFRLKTHLNYKIRETDFFDDKVVWVKPLRFMNNSGKVVKNLINFYKLQLNDMLVICDDIYLPFGNMRFKLRGGDGGHNGLKSIIEQLDNYNWPRLKIGVGSSSKLVPNDKSQYVLGRFTKEELKSLLLISERAAVSISIWLQKGIQHAMNFTNANNHNVL
jgi:PTH1 family peptidyl-tRNA hydrolase